MSCLRMRSVAYIASSFLAIAIFNGPLFAQANAGSITGTIQDQQGGVIPNAKVTLTNEQQGAASARDITTNAEGTFVFTPVLAGSYSLSVDVQGFKKYTQNDIVLDVSQKLGLPPISLQIGATGESVSVEANAVQLETQTAERSGVVTGSQVVDIAINGRNYTSLLKVVPGIPADAGTGDVSVNGGRTAQNNFTLDGQNVTDVGVNQQFAYRISMDAIAEFKVSTNSMTAEYGRNDGAQVQVITKSGAKSFHGDGYWFKRGEFMNANTFTNNFGGIQKAIYRYMDAGWTLGGPIYIPKLFNKNKEKLFGFMSQEWNHNIIPGTLHQITVPTALERMGNFSQTHDGAGVFVPIIDPTNKTPFSGNIIPQSRFSPYGQALLNWLPLPNTFGQNLYNYQSQVSSSQPSYDQIYRVDYNMSEKWRFFVRGLDSIQTQNVPYGRADTSNNLALTPFYAPTYGWSITTNVATIITPTLTNEFQFGYTVNGIPGNAPVSGSPYYRSVSGINVPLLYPAANISGVIPNLNFGTPVSGATSACTSVFPTPVFSMTCFAGTPYHNRNPVWNYIDNVTKVAGTHTIKAGIYYEFATKTENAFKPYNGSIDFARDSNNPGDSNWGLSNALLGNYTSYTQINADPLPSYHYSNLEFYGQDTWKVSSKLTVNYGLRVAFVVPFKDNLGLMSNFDYSKYDPNQAVIFYQPGGAASGPGRFAVNPITGQTLPAAYIGAIVPGIGNINNGMVLEGTNGEPRGLLDGRGPQWGPRLGIAYQIDNKTVFRAGGGAFYERVATFGPGITSNYTTNPPSLRTATLYYGNVADLGSTAGTFFPTQINRLSSDGHVPTVYNFNAGVQRELPWKLFGEVSYVGSQSRHLWLAQPFNVAPFGSAWRPYSQDPTLVDKFDGTTNLPVNMYRPYAGFAGATDYTWGTSANYNALQTSLNKRVGHLQMGAAYTWSKALGVGVGHPTDTRAYGYGPLPQDRTHSFVLNYIYDLPGLSRKGFLDNSVSRVVLNGWQLSGITSVSSGAPINVTYSVTGIGTAVLNRETTGSEDFGPRIVFTCNPNMGYGDRNLNEFVNTSCFGPAPKGSIGLDSGYDRLRGPGLQNWDMSLFKNISIKERARIQLRLEAFDVFNHAEWATINSTAQFASTTSSKIVNLPTQFGGGGGRFGFGAENTIRGNLQRVLQVATKFTF
ncbi:MAG TPA: carboxypeptidase regulatory-like domain-containing protein [Bryobacteraceae bacterium]|nr:carboxypeptidase regulatory-like domain-containing protein [Bryobacteraceae bacterium]